MSWGTWIQPDPVSGTVVFDQDSPIEVPIDSFGGTIEISPQQFGYRNVTNTYGDAVDRRQDMWDKLRGVNDVAGDTGNLYSGLTFSVTMTDEWNIEVSAQLDISDTYPNKYQYSGLWGTLGYNEIFYIPIPPGAITVEVDGAPSSVVDVSLSYSDPPPIDGVHALSDFAGSTAILGDFPLQSNTGHYPYNLLTAMSPPPSNTLGLDDTHRTFHVLPSSLLDSTTPPAEAVVPPETTRITTYRADRCTFTADYTVVYPRYRFLYADTPPRRQYPRPSHRVYPPPPFASSTRTGPTQIL